MDLIGFSANRIQFGLDQLHDAATEDLILYIHWFVWTSYAGLLPMKLGFDTIGDEFFLFSPWLNPATIVRFRSNPLHSTIQTV